MKAVWVVLVTGILIACTNPTGSTDLDDLTEPEEPTDPAFWFKDIYEELLDRDAGGDMGQIANCQYICDAINAKWGAGTISPVPGTGLQVANCEYLLKMIDRANGDRTTYGTSSYATQQIVDTIAVNQAVDTLQVPEGMFITYGSSLAYSTDGINWTAGIIIPPGSWRCFAYGNGMFIAVGSNIAAYSTDGINWTAVTIPLSYRYAVTYGNGIFVSPGLNGVIYSTDGINWTKSSLSSGSWNYVTYGGE